MAWDGLTECVCGHVANHHLVQLGCQVNGCPCRKFQARPERMYSAEQVRTIIRNVRAEERKKLETKIKDLQYDIRRLEEGR